MPYYFKPFEIWQKKLKIYQYWCFSYFNVACFAVVPTCSSKPDDYALYILAYFNIFPLLYYLYSSHIMSYFSSCLDYHSGEIKISLDDYLSLSLAIYLSLYQSLFLSFSVWSPLSLWLSLRCSTQVLIKEWDELQHEMSLCGIQVNTAFHGRDEVL